MSRLTPMLVVTALLLAACTGEVDTTPSPTPDPGIVSPAPTTPQPVTAEPTPAVTAEPTDEPGTLPPFDCDLLPLEGDATADLVNIADVRVAEHDGHDRVVFEFQAYEGRETGIPEHLLRSIDPPLRDNPRGQEMDVAGNAFLHLTLLGGTRLTAEFEETYEAPLQFEERFPQLRELVEAGDFEATADWYIGLEQADPCLRVMTLDDPARLVIDVEHP